VARDLGNRADVLGASRKSDLDGLHGQVFQYGARLLRHGLVVNTEVVEHLCRITRIGAAHHGAWVPSHRRARGYVGRQPTSAAGIAGIEHENACGAGIVAAAVFEWGIFWGGGGCFVGHGPDPAEGVAPTPQPREMTRYNRCILCEGPLSCDRL